MGALPSAGSTPSSPSAGGLVLGKAWKCPSCPRGHPCPARCVSLTGASPGHQGGLVGDPALTSLPLRPPSPSLKALDHTPTVLPGVDPASVGPWPQAGMVAAPPPAPDSTSGTSGRGGETPWGPHTPQVRPAWLEEPAGGRPRSHLLCPHGSLEHQEGAGGGEQEAGFGGGRRSCPGAALGGPAAPPRAERAGGSGLAVGSTPALAACAPRGHRQIPPRPPLQLPPTFGFGALTGGGARTNLQAPRVKGRGNEEEAECPRRGSGVPMGNRGSQHPKQPSPQGGLGPGREQGAGLPSGCRSARGAIRHTRVCTRTYVHSHTQAGGNPRSGLHALQAPLNPRPSTAQLFPEQPASMGPGAWRQAEASPVTSPALPQVLGDGPVPRSPGRPGPPPPPAFRAWLLSPAELTCLARPCQCAPSAPEGRFELRQPCYPRRNRCSLSPVPTATWPPPTSSPHTGSSPPPGAGG